MSKPWENKSGCPDPTAYAATKLIMDEEQTLCTLVHVLRNVANLAGFEITERIVLRSKETGRVYR